MPLLYEDGQGGRRRLYGFAGTELVLFLTNLLAIAFAGKCFFHPLLLARLQVKRVTLYFLDNVFCLHFTLEPAKRVFKGLTLLNTNLCQRKYTSKPSLMGVIP